MKARRRDMRSRSIAEVRDYRLQPHFWSIATALLIFAAALAGAVQTGSEASAQTVAQTVGQTPGKRPAPSPVASSAKSGAFLPIVGVGMRRS